MKSIRAIERCADVLLSFSPSEQTQDIARLARSLRLSRATLYRILHTLELKGLVRSFGEPLQYELAHRAGTIADAWISKTPALATCKPFLEELSVGTSETVALMVPLGHTMRTCIYERRGARVLAFSRGVGYAESIFKGASGKVLLANFSEYQRSEALRLVDAPQRKRLLAELVQIRAQGYAKSAGELEPGAASIAATIRDDTGNVVASLCLFGAAVRFEGEALSRYVRDLSATARLASEALGYRSETR